LVRGLPSTATPESVHPEWVVLCPEAWNDSDCSRKAPVLLENRSEAGVDAMRVTEPERAEPGYDANDTVEAQTATTSQEQEMKCAGD